MMDTAKRELGPNQRKWIEALRSGVFEQGANALNWKNKFCCLGVACEVFSLPKSVKENECVAYGVSAEAAAAPMEVRELLAIRSSTGRIDGNVAPFITLVGMNDSGKATFAQIADFCEQNPEAVFTEAR